MKNFKILAITFSVILNIVFMGSSLYHGVGPLTPAAQQGHKRPLYEELGLSRAQLKKIKPIRDNFHAFVNDQGRRIKVKELELVALLAKQRPNRRALAAKQEEIRALQRQMQTKVIDHFLEESRIFTREQRVKLFTLIRGRIEKNGSPRPRWMPPQQTNPAVRVEKR